jgi:hypothetical protein
MEFYDSDDLLPRFNRLMQDVIKGDWRRNSFAPWELALILDIQACADEIASRRDLLPRYQKAVQRQLSRRREMPMTLSSYVESLRVRQSTRTAGSPESADMTFPDMSPAIVEV